MMLAPSDPYDIDLHMASSLLGDSVLRGSDEMLEFMFEDIRLTLYRNGNLMFYHFNDPEQGKRISDDVLALVTSQ